MCSEVVSRMICALQMVQPLLTSPVFPLCHIGQLASTLTATEIRCHNVQAEEAKGEAKGWIDAWRCVNLPVGHVPCAGLCCLYVTPSNTIVDRRAWLANACLELCRSKQK